jgi:hypothetical protein
MLQHNNVGVRRNTWRSDERGVATRGVRGQAGCQRWGRRSEPGIKYYSGRATYKKTFDAAEAVRATGRGVYLDLGSLRCLAEVRLNGKDLGVFWCPPWRAEVTGLLKPTDNMLEIDIVNVWANRIIGDAALPPEKRRTWTSPSDTIGATKPNTRLIPTFEPFLPKASFL